MLIADTLQNKSWKSWLWLAISAAIALFAIDEIFGFHERTRDMVGDDDYSKMAQWVLAGGGLYVINRIGVSSLKARIAFVTGYIVHTLYLLSDLGDGDFFTVPFVSRVQLLWAEEYLELFSLLAYFIGILFLYTATRVAINKYHQNNSLKL